MPLLLLIAACWSLTAQAPAFRTVRWTDLPPGSRPLLAAAGLSAELLPAWLQQHQAGTQRRLDRGAAEHVAYFLLQSRRLTADPPIVPVAAARKVLAALTPADRARF